MNILKHDFEEKIGPDVRFGEEKGKKPHHPHHHDLPPHILKELLDLKEKVGKLEGQMDVLLRVTNKEITSSLLKNSK